MIGQGGELVPVGAGKRASGTGAKDTGKEARLEKWGRGKQTVWRAEGKC